MRISRNKPLRISCLHGTFIDAADPDFFPPVSVAVKRKRQIFKEYDPTEPDRLFEEFGKAEDFKLTFEKVQLEKSFSERPARSITEIEPENSDAKIRDEHCGHTYRAETPGSKRSIATDSDPYFSPEAVATGIELNKIPYGINTDEECEDADQDGAVDAANITERPSILDVQSPRRKRLSLLPKLPLQFLLDRCNHDKPVPFAEYIKRFRDPVKIGEGSYGEAFRVQNDKSTVVLKIIPFFATATQRPEDSYVKTAEEILPELIITNELSKLALSERNRSTGFVPLIEMTVVEGIYPEALLAAFAEFKETHKSLALNESPITHTTNLFCALSLGFGGSELERFKLTSYQQAISVIMQVIYSLIAAEDELEFEHRDLHLSNILVQSVPKDEVIKLAYSSKSVVLNSMGVKATIIDFTNSRITVKGEYWGTDLANDEELFSAEGDYQFEIYRMMRTATNNDWSEFCPRTNCMWIHYLYEKLIGKPKTVLRLAPKVKKSLRVAFDKLLECDSLRQFIEQKVVKDIMKLAKIA